MPIPMNIFKSFARTLIASIFALLACSANATYHHVVQEFFVPLPEDQVQKALSTITTGVGSEMNTVISIIITADNTYIHYDHWEDGYEIDLENPVQSTTEVTGPHAKGTVLSFRNTVALPRDPSIKKYDGRDRIGASIAVVATRAEWATAPGTVLAGAAEMLSVRDYGNDYKMPVGQNQSAIDNGMFKYVGMLMVASQDNTSCTYTDISSVVTNLPTQNRGSNYQMNGGVKAGDHLVCDKPVQVHLITGDVGAKYESRWFLVYPTTRWSSDYYTPVGTSSNGDVGYVFAFNPSASSITVNYETLTGTGNFAVAGNSASRFQIPVSSGAHFYSTGGQPFYAVATFGATPTANNVHDWGMLLVPTGALTTEIIAGWAPGNGNPTPTDNGSPLWVTVERDSTVYVDYNGNGGLLTAANGQKYDVAVPVKRLQSLIVSAPNFDNTGTRIFTTDGTRLTGAWGQNSAVAGAGAPYLDMGTAVLPFPVPSILKSAALMTSGCNGGSNDTNGIAAIGECLRYTLTINNAGLTTLDAALIVDDLGTAAGGGLTYQAGSTKINGVAVADAAGSSFPLTTPGYLIADIPPGVSTTVTYDAKITKTGSLTNSVFLNNPNIRASHTVIVPPTSAAVCTLNFTNSGGTTATTYSAGDVLYFKLSNADLAGTGTQAVLVKNPANGSKDTEAVTLTETSSGIFTGSLSSSPSAGQTLNDGTFFLQLGDSIQVSSTYPTCAAASASVPVPTKTKTLYLADDASSGDLTGGMSRTAPVSGTAKSTAILGGGSSSTITVDGAATVSPAALTGSTLTFSHTTGSGSNTLLLVGVSFECSGASCALSAPANTVKFGGTSLTLVGRGINTTQDAAVEIWKMLSPPASTTANVVVTLGLAQDSIAGAVTLAGVDQSQTLTLQSVAGASGVPSLTVTSATGEMVFDVVTWDQPTDTGTAPGTSHWNTRSTANDSSTAGIRGAASTIAGAASVAANWTTSATGNWYIGAVSVKPATAVGNTTATFTQTPTMATGLTIPAGATVAARAYYTVSTGSMPASPAITATLKYGATTIATSSSASASAGLLTFTFAAQAGSLTVPAGQAIVLEITTAQSGVTFTVDYDGTSAVSKVDLPTTTVIAVDSLALFDAPYPGGSAVTSANNGQTLYARTTVSDPFGAYDITSLNLTIDGPGTACDLAPVLGAGNVINTTTTSKVYEYPWATSSCEGGYTVTGVAHEGTEGTVTASGAAQLTLTALDLGTPGIVQFLDNTGVDKTSYTTAQQVCLKVTDLDQAGRAEPILVYVTGGSAGTVSLTLAETPVSSGIFKGCFGSSGSSAPFVNGDVLSATYTDPTDGTDVATDTALVTNGAVPSLLLSKVRVSPAGGITVVGGSVQYDITATNTGVSSLTAVALSDTYSSSCYSYQSATLAPSTNTPGSLGWSNIGPIAAGGTVRISVTLVANGACNSGAATNSVSASGDATAGPATASVTINNPKVSVTKTRTSAATANIGDTVSFDIVVTNSGNTNIETLPVADGYSSCLQFMSATPTATSSGGGTVLWSDLLPGAAVLTPSSSTTIATTFKVVGTCSSAQNAAEVNFAVDINGFTAVAGSASASVATAAASISGQVVNDNGAGSGGVAFDGLKNGSEPGIASVTVKLYRDPNGDGSLGDATLVAVQTTDSSGNYTFLNLAPNTGTERYVVVQSEPLRYRVTSPISNQIIVNVAAVQDYPGNNFLDAYAADVMVQKNGFGAVPASGVARYTVQVYNAGPGDANGTVLSDGVPTGVTNMAWTCAGALGGAVCPVASGTGAISQTIASLPAGSRLTYSVSATAPASGSYTNSATATLPATIFDPDTSNNSASVTTALAVLPASANLSVLKYAPANVPADASLSYQMLVSNAGPSAANGAVFSDAVPSGLTSVSWTCGNAVGGALCPAASGSGAISETIATFPAGSHLTYTVTGTAPSSGTVSNTASIAAPAGLSDPDSANNSATVTTTIGANSATADLAIAKSGPATIAASATVTYKLTVSNDGPDAVLGAHVLDSVPLSLTTVAWVCGSGAGGASCGTASGSGNNIDATVNLSAGASITITVTGSAPATGASFVNAARVVAPSGTSDPTPGNNISGPVITHVQTGLNSVLYDGNGNSGGSVPTDGASYAPGATVTVLANTGTLVRSGYTFVGWNTAADGTGTSRAAASSFAMGSSAVTLYAQWTALPTYSVTYNGNTSTGGTAPIDAASPYLTGATVTVLGAGTLVKSGYSFVGWNTAANGTGTSQAAASSFNMGSSAVTLYAQWTALPTYSVTYNGNTSTGGTAPTDAASPYLTGATVTVLDAGTLVKSGYSFVGWNTAANGNGTSRAAASNFSMGSSAVTLYAQWTALAAPVATDDVAPAGRRTLSPASNDTASSGAVLDPSTVDLDPATPGVQRGPIVTSQGTWRVIDNAGTVSFEPAPGFYGTATKIYAVSDSSGNTATATMSVPVDPSGVVYNSSTRLPIAGATVTLLYNGGNANAVVVGGNATQTTNASGQYAFFLLPAAQAGTYSLSTSATGYSGAPSTLIAPTAVPGGFTGGSVGYNGVPPVGQVTIYYLSFPLPLTDITNNNIPLDAVVVPPAVATSVPTLSEWGLLMLSSLMVMFAVAQLRRRGDKLRS